MLTACLLVILTMVATGQEMDREKILLGKGK